MKALIYSFLFLGVLLPISGWAQSYQPVFEAIARYNMQQTAISDLCAGIRYASTTYYQCQSLNGDAKIACDAFFYGGQRNYACRIFDPAKGQKLQRDMCDGVFYGVFSQYSCDTLNPRTEKPLPAEFYAKENCQGVYQSRFNPNNCAQLAAAPRAMAICNYIKTWNPNTSPCKR